MISEDDANPQNLDVITPSSLSSPSDQSAKVGEAIPRTESSSAGSSLSDFKKRIQDLPSPNENVHLSCCTTPISRRTPRNRDIYLHLQSSTNRIEEREEPEDKEQLEGLSKRRDARARRRAKLRTQLETNEIVLPLEVKTMTSAGIARDYEADPKSPNSLDFNKPLELDSARQSSAKTYPDNYLDHDRSSIHNTYRLSSLSADNRKLGAQQEVPVLREGSSLPLMWLPSERVDIRPLPSLSLSKAPPTKFGGYRPVENVVVKNLNFGTDTESNQSSRISTPCLYDRDNRVTGFPTFDSISPIVTSGIDDRNSKEQFLLSNLPSPIAVKSADGRRVLSSRKEKSVIYPIISAGSVRTRDDTFLLTNLTTAKVTKHDCLDSCSNTFGCSLSGRIPTFPETGKVYAMTFSELPVLSARSNICDYNRTVTSAFHESSFSSLPKSLATEVILPARRKSTPVKKVFEEEKIEAHRDLATWLDSARSDDLCSSSAEESKKHGSQDTFVNETLDGSRENVKKLPLTERIQKESSIHVLRAVQSEKLLRKDRIETLWSERQEQSKETEVRTVFWKDVVRTGNIEIPRQKTEELVKTCVKNDDIKVPSLSLTSRDVTHSTSPTNRTYTQSKVLDTDALITALSNVSLKLDRELTRNDSRTSNTKSVPRVTSSHSSTIEEHSSISTRTFVANSASRKSLKAASKPRSRIPVKTPSIKNTASAAASKYANDEKPFYSTVNVYESESMSIDSNSQTMPNAAPLSATYSFEPNSKYLQDESETVHKCLSGRDYCNENIPGSNAPDFSSNTREDCRQLSQRESEENKLQSYNDFEKPFGQARTSLPNTQSQTLEILIGSDNSRYRSMLETPNLSFRSKSDYSKYSDETRSEEKYRRSSKSDDYESCDAYDDDTTGRSDLTEPRGTVYPSHQGLLGFNDEECMRLNLSIVQEMSSIEELSEKTGAYDEKNSKAESNNSLAIPVRPVNSTRYKSTQVPSWHSDIRESFRCTEDGQNFSDEDSDYSLKAEDEDSSRVRSKSIINDDPTPRMRKKPRLDEETLTSLNREDENSDEETDNSGKLQFSIEKLAADKFRRCISLEQAKGNDNTYRRYGLQCSASTSKLGSNKKRIVRTRKKSQDRFPFTISEKESAGSTKIKPVPENRHLNDKKDSLEKVYKLALHPSITRLAGGGIQDNVSEIMHCIAYSHEDEKRNSRMGMRRLVQKFSAKFKGAKKGSSRRKLSLAEANVLYQNETYQGESEVSSCSESSLLKGLKPRANELNDGKPSSPDEASSTVCEKSLSKEEEQKNVSSDSETPRRRQCDGQWVQSLSNTESDHQTPNLPETNSPNQSAQNTLSAFFVKEDSNVPESYTTSCPDQIKPSQSAKVEQFKKTTSRCLDPISNKAGRLFKRNNGDKGTAKQDDNSDSETDCACLKVCCTIPRMCKRSRRKYPSSIKRSGHR